MLSFMNQKTEEGVRGVIANAYENSFQGNKIVLKLDCDNCTIPWIDRCYGGGWESAIKRISSCDINMCKSKEWKGKKTNTWH